LAFKVFLHPKAAKAREKLDANTKARIKGALKELAGNPEKVGKKLKLSDFWSLRIGDYRAIYEIDRDKNQVVVIFIGHRKNVYDDFTKML
jgi:mRNA interferase RelE/StbE